MATSEFTTGNRNCVAACFHRNRSYRYCRMQLSGNCIVVDHGYGLQTIYGHLSQTAVHEGDMVKRGQVMDTSGQTGMAGGDHIHFAMPFDGIQIDPKVWWDSHWIRITLRSGWTCRGSATEVGSPPKSTTVPTASTHNFQCLCFISRTWVWKPAVSHPSHPRKFSSLTRSLVSRNSRSGLGV